MRRILCWSSLFLLLFMGSACVIVGNDDPTNCDGNGDLAVDWIFGGDGGCPADAENMYVEVYDLNGDPIHTETDGEVASCLDGGITFRALACGPFAIRVHGVDSSGFLSWESAEVNVVVREGRLNAFTVNLLPTP
ncbi:MAG TPA: hypothetical protein DCE42_09075 [Myxococcales bacterium]|nr:hypothetical protein [Myxococcales bacterium]